MRSSRGGQPHGLIVGNKGHNRDILSILGMRATGSPSLAVSITSSQQPHGKENTTHVFSKHSRVRCDL